MKSAPKGELLGTAARLRIIPDACVEKTQQFSYVPGPNEMLIPIEAYRYLCGGSGNPIYDRLMWGVDAPIGGLLG